jgi:hypothetical protein
MKGINSLVDTMVFLNESGDFVKIQSMELISCKYNAYDILVIERTYACELVVISMNGVGRTDSAKRYRRVTPKWECYYMRKSGNTRLNFPWLNRSHAALSKSSLELILCLRGSYVLATAALSLSISSRCSHALLDTH